MRRSWLVLVLALSFAACAKSQEFAAPPESSSAGAASTGLSLDEYERLLAQNEAALRSHGVHVPATKLAFADELDTATGDEDASGEAGGVVGGMVETEEAGTGQSAPAASPEPTLDEADDAAFDKERPDRTVSEGNRRAERRQNRDRCEMICELADATCDLEAKICGLARQHTNDPRYANACSRATRDCDIAEEACRACAD